MNYATHMPNFAALLEIDEVPVLPRHYSDDPIAYHLHYLTGASIKTPTPTFPLRQADALLPLARGADPDTEWWVVDSYTSKDFHPPDEWPGSLRTFAPLTTPRRLYEALTALRRYQNAMVSRYLPTGAVGLVSAGAPLTLHPDLEDQAYTELLNITQCGPLLVHLLDVDPRWLRGEDNLSHDLLILRSNPLCVTKRRWMQLLPHVRQPSFLMTLSRRTPNG